MKFTHEIGDIIRDHEILAVVPNKRYAYSKQKGKTVGINDPRVSLRCSCCGYEKTVHGTRLKYISCDHGPCHPRFVDIAGHRFGKLVALEYVNTEEDKNRQWKWLCKCDCGATEIISRGSLMATKKSCRNCMYGRVGDHNRLPKEQAAWNRLEREYIRNAGNRGYAWELTTTHFRILCEASCYYCGTPPLLREHRNMICNGIDRLDNTKGYTIDNSVPCCKICNLMKRDYTKDGFISHLFKIVQYQTKERSSTIPEGSTPKQVEMEQTLAGNAEG